MTDARMDRTVDALIGRLDVPAKPDEGFVTATGVRQKGGVWADQVSRCCDGV